MVEEGTYLSDRQENKRTTDPANYRTWYAIKRHGIPGAAKGIDSRTDKDLKCTKKKLIGGTKGGTERKKEPIVTNPSFLPVPPLSLKSSITQRRRT